MGQPRYDDTSDELVCFAIARALSLVFEHDGQIGLAVEIEEDRSLAKSFVGPPRSLDHDTKDLLHLRNFGIQDLARLHEGADARPERHDEKKRDDDTAHRRSRRPARNLRGESFYRLGHRHDHEYRKRNDVTTKRRLFENPRN